jgi:antitoxin component of MazEF toxin-antitoxin module
MPSRPTWRHRRGACRGHEGRNFVATAACVYNNTITMQKQLVRVGDSTGIVIDKPLLGLMGGLTAGDTVSLDIVDGRLVISALQADKAEARYQKLRASMHKNIGRTLAKLAK